MGKGAQGQRVVDYNMSVHFGCGWEFDALTGLTIDNKWIWPGTPTNFGTVTPISDPMTESGTITINLPKLNGGPTQEGGPVGTIYFLKGDGAQVLPDNLAARMGLTGATCPAYRGMTSLFFVGLQDAIKADPSLILSEIFSGDGLSAKPSAGFHWTSNNPVVATTLGVRGVRIPKGLNTDTATITYTVDTTTITHDNGDGTKTVTTYVDGTDPGIEIDIGDVITTGTSTVTTANGAGIIYEALTNTAWGLGAPTSMVDTAAYQAAADTLYAEGLGLSVIWVTQSTVEDFVNEILSHIQAVCYFDPAAGKHSIRLIRDDYDVDTLPLYTPDNAKFTNYQRRLPGEFVNEITVSWTNPLNEQQEGVTVQDLASIATQGSVSADSRNYYGARTAAVATFLAARDLRGACAPLRSCEMQVNRASWTRKSGDVIKINWPKYRLDNVVMRVGKTDYGKPGDSSIKLTLTEDVFTQAPVNIASAPSSIFTDPASNPSPLDAHQLLTIPAFFALTGSLSQTSHALSYPEVLTAALASEPDRDTTAFDLQTPQTNASGVTGYASVGTKTITERALLTVAMVPETSSTFPISIITHYDRGPSVGGFVVLGSGTDADMEIAMITGIDTSGIVSIARGMLDTTPKAWAIGTPIWILNAGDSIVDESIVRSAGETADYKLLPKTSLGTLAVSTATVVPITLTARPHLPNRPANVQVNGTGFGPVSISGHSSIALTWATRNRTLEEGQAPLWTDGSVTPEYRQQTVVTVKDSGGTVLYQQGGLWTDTSLSLPKTDFDHYDNIFITVSSSRDGLDSLQGHMIEVTGFANDSGAALPPAPPTPAVAPSPFGAPSAGAWTITGTIIDDGAGNNAPAITVVGAPEVDAAEGLVIRYKTHAGSVWSTWPLIALNDQAVSVTVMGLESAVAYDVELYYLMSYGTDGAVLSAPQAYGPVTTGASVYGGTGSDPYYIQGSGVPTALAATGTIYTDESDPGKLYASAPISSTGSHKWWRFKLDSTAGGAFSAAEIGFCLAPGGSSVASGGTPYADQNYLSTSTSGPYGAYNAFDGTTTQLWSSSDSTTGQTIAYGFATPQPIVEVYWQARNDGSYGQSPTSFDIQYSDDSTTGADGTWFTAASFSGVSWTSPEQLQRFTVSGSITANWVLVSGGGGSGSPGALGFFAEGLLADGELLVENAYPLDLTFTNGAATDFITCYLTPLADATFPIETLLAGVWTHVGAAKILAAANAGTITWDSSPYTLPAFQRIRISAPSPNDAQMSDPNALVVGT